MARPLATAVAGAYLIWFWKRWMLITLPVVVVAMLLANPFGIGDRIVSAFKPNGDRDSNAHRAVTRRLPECCCRSGKRFPIR